MQNSEGPPQDLCLNQCNTSHIRQFSIKSPITPPFEDPGREKVLAPYHSSDCMYRHKMYFIHTNFIRSGLKRQNHGQQKGSKRAITSFPSSSSRQLQSPQNRLPCRSYTSKTSPKRRPISCGYVRGTDRKKHRESFGTWMSSRIPPSLHSLSHK